jgi:hypothetical protein
MKKLWIAVLSLLIWGATQGETQAQVSLSLSGNYSRFFGEGIEKFPFGVANDFSHFWNGTARVNVGIRHNLSYTGGFTYGRMPNRQPFGYGEFSTLLMQRFELESNLNYYLLGAYNERGGLYLMGGITAGFYPFGWELAEVQEGKSTYPPPVERRDYFQDGEMWLLGIQGGLGMEVYTGSFYIFSEGKVNHTFKDYMSHQTIKEMHLRNFWQVALGVRIPLGGR